MWPRYFLFISWYSKYDAWSPFTLINLGTLLLTVVRLVAEKEWAVPATRRHHNGYMLIHHLATIEPVYSFSFFLAIDWTDDYHTFFSNPTSTVTRTTFHLELMFSTSFLGSPWTGVQPSCTGWSMASCGSRTTLPLCLLNHVFGYPIYLVPCYVLKLFFFLRFLVVPLWLL